MSVKNLDKIFHPKSIAVVGASERKGSVGHAIMHNLVKSGYSGDIYPINAKHRKLWGKPSCTSIEHLNTGVDLAVLATPIMSATNSRPSGLWCMQGMPVIVIKYAS